MPALGMGEQKMKATDGGKGSWRRPYNVSRYTENYDKIFNKSQKVKKDVK